MEDAERNRILEVFEVCRVKTGKKGLAVSQDNACPEVEFLRNVLFLAKAVAPRRNSSVPAELPLLDDLLNNTTRKCTRESAGAWCALDLLHSSFDVKIVEWGRKVAIFVADPGSAAQVSTTVQLYQYPSSSGHDKAKILLRNLAYASVAERVRKHRPAIIEKSSMALLLEVLGVIYSFAALGFQFFGSNKEAVVKNRALTPVNMTESAIGSFVGGEEDGDADGPPEIPSVQGFYRAEDGTIQERGAGSTATLLSDELFDDQLGWLEDGLNCVLCGSDLDGCKWGDIDTIHLFRRAGLAAGELQLISRVQPRTLVAEIGVLNEHLKDHFNFVAAGCKRCNSGFDYRGETLYDGRLHRWRKVDVPDADVLLAMELKPVDGKEESMLSQKVKSFLLESKTRQRVWSAHKVVALCCTAGRYIQAADVHNITFPSLTTARFYRPPQLEDVDSVSGMPVDPAVETGEGSAPSLDGSQPASKKHKKGATGTQGKAAKPTERNTSEQDDAWLAEVALRVTRQMIQQRKVAQLDADFGL